MKARSESSPVDGAAAHALAAVIGAEREGILSAGYARIFPVKLVRSGFIGDPVAFGVPERAGFERNYIKACARQTLQQNSARGSATDDCVVHFITFAKATHGGTDLLQWPPACAAGRWDL